jgi:tRNA G10  N-methylase Trm11
VQITSLEQQLFTYIQDAHPYEDGVKLKIGISDYSRTLSTNQLTKAGLSLKKLLKKDGYSVRIVPNKGATLGSAQIIHNRLTAENGIEFVLYKHQGNLCVATTVHEQDIEAYAARDQARPLRDARVGMLPPKLAQTIINLATGPVRDQGLATSKSGNGESLVPSTHALAPTVLDPFCGTGVVLQEALLMGYTVIGTDLEPRMITYSEENITWLRSKYPELPGTANFAIGDASQLQWQPTPDFIAAETYLGKPFSAMPTQHELVEVVQSVNTLHKKVLQNIHAQITPKTRICLAVPAWRTKKGFVHLPVLDQLDKLGYNQLVFSHVNAKNLVYARADQIVARQLVVLQKR